MTRWKSGSFDALRCATKSTMPPSYLNTCSVGSLPRSSRNTISRPLFKKAISRSRSSSVCARNSSSSMIVGSGQNVTDVPDDVESPMRSKEPSGSPPSTKVCANRPPSRWISSSSRRDERVDHRDADAVQTPGNLVALAAELAARVQHREHDLGRGFVGIFGVRVDGNSAPVVDDATAAVGEQGHIDTRRVARECLVDRVVDDLVDEVMEARRAGRADVHTGALAHRLEALQNGDVFGAVRHA